MENIIIIFAVLIFAVIIMTYTSTKEGMGSSGGALIQLAAKGPQDWYLTGDPGIRTKLYDIDPPYDLDPYWYYPYDENELPGYNIDSKKRFV